LHWARYPARVHLLVHGESLAVGMSEYLITQLKATPNVQVHLRTRVVDAPGDSGLGPSRSRSPGQARVNASPLPLSSS
jgi:thioredoxin reductase (NADPH)